MTDEIKEILKRYDEIEALILEQKIDEFGDHLGQVPKGSDAASFEEYIQDIAREETDKATLALETEPDGPRHSLTAPAIMPAATYFWVNANMMTVGTTAMTAPADSSPQRMSFFWTM